jgi:putative hydrolase of the HAD superfamily
MQTPRRQGLVVDFGGVLTTSVRASFRSYCTEVGLPEGALGDVIAEVYRAPGGDGPIQQLETGRISIAEFGERLAALLSERGHPVVDGADLVQGLFAGVELDERVLGAVERIRELGVRTALLSNSWGGNYPRDRFPALFDAVVISAEVGMRKPDPAIFRLAADQLGLDAEQCVFVDDLEHNVRAAEDVGMTGVWHRDPDETIHRCCALLDLDPALVDRDAATT